LSLGIRLYLLAGAISLGLCAKAIAGPLEDGEGAINRRDYSAAMILLAPLAEDGNAQAQYEVGRMYEGGKGVALDYAKAATWYEKSGLGGDHRAQLLLSLMYARGQGVAQDNKQGLYWLSKASEGESPQKQDGMRRLYFETRGSFDQGRQLNGAELLARALPGLQQLADKGDPNAKCALLQIYQSGQAVARKDDDIPSLQRTCAGMEHKSTGQPPPAITARPIRPAD